MARGQEMVVPKSLLAGRVPYLQPDHRVGLIVYHPLGLKTGSHGARCTRRTELIFYISLNLKIISY